MRGEGDGGGDHEADWVNVLDLFSGIGGFSLGLERAGMRTVAFCEIDPYCREVLRKHWPNIPIFDDVRRIWFRGGNTFYAGPLSGGWQTIDLICGGFPCQDISVAGKGAGVQGTRSGLWSEFARIIGEVRPRYVIVENVAALLGRGIERVLGDLAALGFDAEWHCIPASAVGAPHRRDRVWIIANDRGKRKQGILLQAIQEQPEFSWCKNVRRIEDLPIRSDLYPSQLCGMRNGISARLDAIGNAVVPQIAEILGKAIMAHGT